MNSDMRIGRSIFSLKDQTLSCQGRCIKLSWQNSEVLRIMLQAKSRQVTRNELIEKIWNGNYLVGNRGVTQAIWTLRKALRLQNMQECIRTIPKYGYELIVDTASPRVDNGVVNMPLQEFSTLKKNTALTKGRRVRLIFPILVTLFVLSLNTFQDENIFYTTQKAEQDDIAAFIGKLLLKYDIATDDYDFKDKKNFITNAIKLIEGEFEKQPMIRSELLLELAKKQIDLEDYQVSESLLNNILSIRIKEYGYDSVEVADVHFLLASSLLRQGKPPRNIESIILSSIENYKRTLGEQHYKTIDAIELRGILHRYNGETEKAKEIFERTLCYRKKNEHRYPLKLATNLERLSTVLNSNIQELNSIELLMEALSIRERELGEVHPETATTYYHIAQRILESKKFQYDTAVFYSNKAIEAFSNSFGADSRMTAMSRSNLSSIHKRVKNYEDAISEIDQAISSISKKLGTQNAIYAILSTNKAELYRLQGDFVNAKKMIDQTVLLVESVFSAEHWRYNITNSIRGSTLTSLGESKKGITMQKSALDALSQKLPRDSQYVTDAMTRAKKSCEGNDLSICKDIVSKSLLFRTKN